MKRSTKEKIFRKVQKAIQNTYLGLFMNSIAFLILFKRFSNWHDLRYVVMVAIITGTLTLLKAKTFLRKPSNRKWLLKEIDSAFRSEDGIKF